MHCNNKYISSSLSCLLAKIKSKQY